MFVGRYSVLKRYSKESVSMCVQAKRWHKVAGQGMCGMSKKMEAMACWEGGYKCPS